MASNEKEDEFINIAMKRKCELDANYGKFKRKIADLLLLERDGLGL